MSEERVRTFGCSVVVEVSPPSSSLGPPQGPLVTPSLVAVGSSSSARAPSTGSIASWTSTSYWCWHWLVLLASNLRPKITVFGVVKGKKNLVNFLLGAKAP
jgi:hypothetical protein